MQLRPWLDQTWGMRASHAGDMAGYSGRTGDYKLLAPIIDFVDCWTVESSAQSPLCNGLLCKTTIQECGSQNRHTNNPGGKGKISGKERFASISFPSASPR
jgi:hypothetical protein